MPEEPTLAHVATTLQFCLEQLQLCEQVTKDHSRLIVADYINDAWKAAFTALDYLRVTGIEPARPQPEGVPA